MATSTLPETRVEVPCGRCGGDGRYGGQVAGGVCFGCHGTGKILIPASRFIAQRKRDQARRQDQITLVKRLLEHDDRVLCAYCEDTGRNVDTGNPCGCIPYRADMAAQARHDLEHRARELGIL